MRNENDYFPPPLIPHRRGAVLPSTSMALGHVFTRRIQRFFSSEAIKELNETRRGVLQKKEIRATARGTGAHDHRPLIRSWARVVARDRVASPLTIDDARAKHDELAAATRSTSASRSELRRSTRMDKLGGKLRNVRSSSNQRRVHRAPAARYLSEAAEGRVRFKQPHSTPRPRLARPSSTRGVVTFWTAPDGGTAPEGRRPARRAAHARRVPSPLTDVPEEMEELAELGTRRRARSGGSSSTATPRRPTWTTIWT